MKDFSEMGRMKFDTKSFYDESHPGMAGMEKSFMTDDEERKDEKDMDNLLMSDFIETGSRG